MKTNRIILYSLIIILGIFIVNSCAKENWEDPKPMDYGINFADSSNYKILTIKELKKRYDGDTTLLNDSIIIEATVISSDLSGNIYKQLYIQDSTGGISIPLDLSAISADYPEGQKIAIKCGGLYLNSVNGLIQLGALYWNNSYWAFGRIQGFTLIDRHIYKMAGGQKITPRTYKITEIVDSVYMTLIRIKDVQFEAIGGTYSGPTNIIDTKSNKVVLYTSSYSTFATKKVPDKSGYMDCICIIFNGAKELLIRDTTDVYFTNPRF